MSIRSPFPTSRVLAVTLVVSVALPVHSQVFDVVPVLVTDQLDSSSIGVTNAGDGSGRLFVTDREGHVQIWTGSVVLATPFLDISSLVSNGGEQGLLGLAFHPDYETNGFFFVYYTDLAGDTAIARYTVSAGDPNVANAASALPILSFSQPFSNHNAGDLHFGPDGYLYISSGDGGGDGCVSQDTTNLLGKILRIDVDGDDFPGDPDRNYAIPPDNPFVATRGIDAAEIWILGLRNPWRFSFDRETGDLWIGDVGEGDWEEFDLLPAGEQAGANLGWPWFEGPDPFTWCEGKSNPFTSCDENGFICPVLQLNRTEGALSAIGGFRYRGSAHPSLVGTYFYTDWGQGRLHAGTEGAGGAWASADLGFIGGFGPTGFGEDEDGEVYYVNSSELRRITGTGPGSIFTDGFESGDVTGWSSSVP